MTRLLNAALAYAANGWAVFPCVPGEKRPATEHGCKDATTDPDQVRTWWQRNPQANIGVATGEPSGIWVLDVDGDEGLDALVGLGHGIPGTLTQHTPSGGLHLIFRQPSGKVGNTARSLGENLDSRGDGGYIVVAPSTVGGVRYRWTSKASPVAVPGWLIRQIRRPPAPRKKLPAPQVSDGTRVEKYVAAAVEEETQLVASTVSGGRNHQLHASAVKLGTLVGAGVLGSDDAYERLLEAARACGHVQDDGERMARKTIQSGLSWGMEHPREVAS